MITEVAFENDVQKWLKEHDILLAAGMSSPRFTISTSAREFWQTQFAQTDTLPTPEVAKALEQPQIPEPAVPFLPTLIEDSNKSGGSDSDGDEPALPEPAPSPKAISASRPAASKPVSAPADDLHIPSSPPQQPTHQQESPKKQVSQSLWDAPQTTAQDHIPSTPIAAPGNDEENIPSSPIVSSERRRTLVARTPRIQTTVNSPRRFVDGEAIPSSPPAYVTPEQVPRQSAGSHVEEDIASSTGPSSDGPSSSVGSQTSQPVKRGRGRPRKSTSQETVSQNKQDAYAEAYVWRNRFDEHRPHISSLFQDHDLDDENRVWMQTATKLHEKAATNCEAIENFFGKAPFDIWNGNDCAPTHWSQESLERLAQLASVAKRNNIPASNISNQVNEARGRRVENDGHKKKINPRITEVDFRKVIDDLEKSSPSSVQPRGKRKRVSDTDLTDPLPRTKRNRPTPSQSQEDQEDQETRRYPKRNRSTPYKEPSVIKDLIPKLSSKRTPWKGWRIVNSPEAESGAGGGEKEDEEEEIVSGKRKRRATKKAKEDEAETESTPSAKRRKLDPPSTPERNEIRSDPIVNITPKHPVADKAQASNGTNAQGREEKQATSADAQNRASPTAWLQKFKELLMDVPTYIWRPRDQREVQATYHEVWERVLDNTSREEE
jgi:hypothetical protein